MILTKQQIDNLSKVLQGFDFDPHDEFMIYERPGGEKVIRQGQWILCLSSKDSETWSLEAIT